MSELPPHPPLTRAEPALDQSSQKFTLYGVGALAILIVISSIGGAFKSANVDGYEIDHFASLPVQSNGREMPLETVARNSLRTISGTTSVEVEAFDANGEAQVTKMPAIVWLLELSARPERADTFDVFRIDHPDVLALFELSQQEGKRFSFDRLQPHFETFHAQVQQVPDSQDDRSPYQQALVELFGKVNLYYGLSASFHAIGGLDGLLLEYASWEMIAGPGSQAFEAREAGGDYDAQIFQQFGGLASRYLDLSNVARLGIVPQEDAPWLNAGEGLLNTIQTGELLPTIEAHARLTLAWREGDAEAFNAALATLHEQTDPQAQFKVQWEALFQRSKLFYNLAFWYVVLLIGFGAVLLKPFEPLRVVLLCGVGTVFALHTVGILARMYLQGYAPVTNLYSSAIFIGWAAVGLGIFLEAWYRRGIGGFCTGLIGFSTLVVAANLYETSASGDTLEPMRAVLNSNFWLATHVLTVSLGYCAMFLGGALAVVYVLMRAFRVDFPVLLRRDLTKMVYGVTCFGLLFSFVGTMLGGVWADQSWGRFWGWDPKENGALMIVLWGALMLHARWGGLVKERGFHLLAIGGNLITAWSWFGTNMLGIGLHTYGFMDAAFVALNLFWLSQLAIIAVGMAPPLRPLFQAVATVYRPTSAGTAESNL